MLCAACLNPFILCQQTITYRTGKNKERAAYLLLKVSPCILIGKPVVMVYNFIVFTGFQVNGKKGAPV